MSDTPSLFDANTRRPRFRALALDLLLNAGLPYGAFLILQARGVGTVSALSISAIIPALVVLVTFVRRGRPDAVGVIVLAATALGVGASLMSGSPIFALAKESFVTGTIGLGFLLSLAARRPLIFYLARGMMAGDAADEAQFDALWESAPRFRTIMRRLTLMWAAALCVEAGLRVVLTYLIPNAAMVAASHALWIVVTALLIALSVWYGRRQRGRMPGQGAAQLVAQPVPASGARPS